MSKFLTVVSLFNNTEKHIEQTFQNVLKQTHQDWILIVGDDFSADPEFRTQLKNKIVDLNDPRIIYYDIKFKRELYLYQNFFKEYDYDYHFTLDADDIIDKNTFEIYNHHFQKYPNVSSIYSDFNRVNEDNDLQMLSLVQPPTDYIEDFNLRNKGEFNTIYSKRSGQHMYGVSRCMRRPAEDAMHIVKNCRSSNDTMFLFFNLNKGDHLNIPRQLYTYIRRKNSDSGVLSTEEHEDFNLNANYYIENCPTSSAISYNPYKEIWLETSAISSCNWLDKINEFSLITDPNIDLNLLNDLYPDKNIILNDFNHKNQIVVWGKLNNKLKTSLNLNSSTCCTVFSSDENYSYPPENITEQFKISSSNFRQELNKYLTNYTWYDYFRQCIVTRSNPTLNKLLIITPHLSTGGGPQYILDFLYHRKHEFSDIKLVEFTNFSSQFLIQKNKLIDLLGKENIYTLGEYGATEDVFIKDKEALIPLIDDFNPTTIWMNGFPEAYEYRLPPDHIMKKVYAKDRTYKIISTTHNNSFDFKNKKYIPDEFMFCSSKHIKDSENIDIPKKIWEVPIIKKQRPNRKSTLTSLGLDPNKLHVLNVGLVCPNKNQKSIFDIAGQTLEKPIQYHFIGNHCFFNQTGITETQRNLSNCKLWGERSDVDIFMSCMDVYLFPSKKELNPLTIKEALSWNMDVIANYDENYTDQYKDLPNFQLIQNLNVMECIIQKSPQTSSQKKNTIEISYNNGPKVEILGDINKEYKVEFIDKSCNCTIHTDIIKNNMWVGCSRKWFTEWVIKVDGVTVDEFNLDNKKVFIDFKSSSIGDTIAWFPYVEEFRKKYNCEVICSTFRNEWFKSKYPKIKLGVSTDPYASYNIGWFYNDDKWDRGMHKNDFKPQPLQKTATDILGLDFEEIKPNIHVKNSSENIKGKYVTLSIQSTAQAKYWNHPTGWQQVVDFLNGKGYKVVLVDKDVTFGVKNCLNHAPNNVINKTTSSLDEVISIIDKADFHLGISSGLSWIAWALNTPVVLVSSFTKPYCEFTTNCTRIYNDTPTSGYFNTHKLDPSDWNWYPFKEIDKMEEWYEVESITPEQVINQIKTIIK